MMDTFYNNIDYLFRIARHLIVNSSYTDNLGLFDGKMGILIFFAHFARYTQKKIYDDFAGKLLDEVYTEIHTETPINFKNGLCGIGWSMEYLLQNNFLDGNSNEVLAGIDAKIMERDPIHMNDKSFETGAAGILFYILTRLFSTKREKEDIPFMPFYLDSWLQIAQKEYVQQSDLGYFCRLFLQWIDHEDIQFTVNKLLPNVILPSVPIMDEEFVYLPFGLKNGSAGIGLKNILS